MKERADAEKACRDPNPIIDGRKANVNLAYLGAKPRNNVHLAALQQQLNHQLQQTQQQTPTALVQAIQLQALLQQHQQMQSIPTRLGFVKSVCLVNCFSDVYYLLKMCMRVRLCK